MKKKTIIIAVITILILMGIFSLVKNIMGPSGPIYEPDDAKVYIHDRLTAEEKQRLNVADVLDIIETEFKYTQDKGNFDDNGVKFIQEEGRKKGKNYSTEDINRVADIELEYMKSIGIEVVDAKQ